MKNNSIWKNVFLLTLSSVFALHIQIANAQDDSDNVKVNSEVEECVITDDE